MKQLGILIIVGALFAAMCGASPFSFIFHSNVELEHSALFPVRLNGKWGYMNVSGKLVVQPRFEMAKDSSEGLARVYENETIGYVDSMGQVVIPPRYLQAHDFSEGLALVQDAQGRVAFVDKTGNIVIDLTSLGVKSFPAQVGSDFSEGLAAIEIGGKTGYVDRTGKMAITPQFD